MAIIRIAGWMLAFIMVAFSGSGPGYAAQPKPPAEEAAVLVTEIDFDECEPVQIRGAIMEIHAASGTYVVAEKEIRRMEVVSSKRVIRTAFLNTEGKPEPTAAFQVGQYVSIKGFAHPDGFIAASAIQKIAKPAAEDGKRKIDPVKDLKKQKAQRQDLSSSAGRK